MITIPGWGIGALEILSFMSIAGLFKCCLRPLHNINKVTYYWLCMTILTGFWETSYITNYNEIVGMGVNLIKTNTSVWTNYYDITYVNPWSLAKIFYAEYGAWADREYMSTIDPWSHTIEGTHALFCAVFALFGMIARIDKKTTKSLIVVGMSMSFQLMNSILYMIEYGIQCQTPGTVNYDRPSFPLGRLMGHRWFMYVNVFWLVMPTFIIFYEIFNTSINNYSINNNNEIENSTDTSDKYSLRKNKKRKYIDETSKYNNEETENLIDYENPPSYNEMEMENLPSKSVSENV
tara:strand:+ start:162 stop:1037 length:876 start_codon:yes stop_codon:yes gene_type:complete